MSVFFSCLVKGEGGDDTVQNIGDFIFIKEIRHVIIFSEINFCVQISFVIIADKINFVLLRLNIIIRIIGMVDNIDDIWVL